jgi:hypothetical protein
MSLQILRNDESEILKEVIRSIDSFNNALSTVVAATYSVRNEMETINGNFETCGSSNSLFHRIIVEVSKLQETSVRRANLFSIIHGFIETLFCEYFLYITTGLSVSFRAACRWQQCVINRPYV